jgi:hypothetical protein
VKGYEHLLLGPQAVPCARIACGTHPRDGHYTGVVARPTLSARGRGGTCDVSGWDQNFGARFALAHDDSM